MYFVAVETEPPKRGDPILEQELAQTNDFVISGSFIVAESTPTYIKPQVLSTKTINYIEPVNQDKWDYLLIQYDWDARLMSAIIMAESGGNNNAINAGDRHSNCNGSYGLTQLSCLHFGKHGLTWDNWSDPSTNIKVAYEIYKTQGLRAWGAYTSGAYLKFY